MSQAAVVSVAVAFISNGLLTQFSPEMGAAANWVISGVVAFAAGMLTLRMGKPK